MIKRTPLLCITVFTGVNHQSHTVELVDWLLQAFVYQEIGTMYNDQKKRPSHFRNLTPNPALAPEGRALIFSGGINNRGIYLPNPERLHSVFSQAQAGHSIIAGGGDQKTIRRPFLSGSFSATRHLQDDDTHFSPHPTPNPGGVQKHCSFLHILSFQSNLCISFLSLKLSKISHAVDIMSTDTVGKVRDSTFLTESPPLADQFFTIHRLLPAK